MKVLLNAAFDTVARVGIATYLRHIVPLLARNHDITVLTPHPEVFARHAHTVRLPRWTRRADGRTFWTVAFAGVHCSSRYDALLCPTPAVPLFSRIPKLALVHDLTPLRMRRQHDLTEKTLFWLGLQTLRWAQGAIAVSQSTKRDMVSTGLMPPDRIAVAYEGPGITPSSVRPGFGHDLKPFILYVGGHAPHKNVPRLIAAFARAGVPVGVRLVLVGHSTPRTVQRTQFAAARVDVSDRVFVLRDLPDDELSGLYRNCELFVYPSLYEGFGLPVLEAMAHGTPVACSRISSIPEVAGRAALYFNPLSVSEIARCITAILGSSSLAACLRELGPRRAAAFTWQRTVDCINSGLTAIAADRNR